MKKNPGTCKALQDIYFIWDLKDNDGVNMNSKSFSSNTHLKSEPFRR